MKYGEANKTDGYAENLKLLCNYGNEKKILAEKLVGCLNLGQEKVLWDIGAGDGAITEVLASKVGKAVAFEVNPSLAETLVKKGLNVVEGEYPESSLVGKADLIVASHLLYYMQTTEAVLDRIVKSLNPGGQAAIIVGSSSGEWYDYCSKFYDPDRVKRHDIIIKTIDGFEMRGVRKTVQHIETEFSMPPEIAMQVWTFFSRTEKVLELAEYLEQYRKDGMITMKCDHTLMLLENETSNKKAHD